MLGADAWNSVRGQRGLVDLSYIPGDFDVCLRV